MICADYVEDCEKVVSHRFDYLVLAVCLFVYLVGWQADVELKELLRHHRGLAFCDKLWDYFASSEPYHFMGIFTEFQQNIR